MTYSPKWSAGTLKGKIQQAKIKLEKARAQEGKIQDRLNTEWNDDTWQRWLAAFERTMDADLELSDLQAERYRMVDFYAARHAETQKRSRQLAQDLDKVRDTEFREAKIIRELLY
jgi:hypothetical protein